MARLQMQPRKTGLWSCCAARTEPTDPPPATPSSHATPLLSSTLAVTDTEAASQQLLAEASQPAAVRGATLLNSARVQPVQPPLAATAPKARAGKLKRPRGAGRPQPRDLPVRREDLYDFHVSPEKKTFCPPEAIGASEPEHVCINAFGPDGNPRCTALDYRNDENVGPYYQQCLDPGSNSCDYGFRCDFHWHRPVKVRCEHLTIKDSTSIRCRNAASNETPHGALCMEHAEAGCSARKAGPSLHSPKSEECAEFEPLPTGDVQTQSQGPIQRLTKTASHKKAACTKRIRTDQYSRESAAHNHQRPSAEKRVSSKKESPLSVHRLGKDSSQPGASGTDSNIETNSDENAAEAKDVGVVDQVKCSRPFGKQGEQEDMDSVCEFLHASKRSGSCQTKLGITIQQRCEQSCVLLQSENVSLLAVLNDLEDFGNILLEVQVDATEEDRCAFKSDVYAYIFRIFAVYLKTLYFWLGEEFGKVTESPDATRVLFELTTEILHFKCIVASWKISLPQRYHGDRMIADVDSDFIRPLRHMNEIFRRRLDQYEHAEKGRKRHLQLESKRKADMDEELRRAELVAVSKARWARWQGLHISRMQCELDPSRRKKLVIRKLEDLEEKDANGFKFERLLVFKSRVTPPWHRTSTMHEDRVWTEAEDIALLEGLQCFAGMLAHTFIESRWSKLTDNEGQHVFEKIFQSYCRPGGVLRDFNVASIVARAAWVRLTFMKLHQEKGWEIPLWVNRIPSVP